MTAAEIADLAGTLTGDRPTIHESGPTPSQEAILAELRRCPALLTDLPARDARSLLYAGYVEHDRRTDVVSVTLAGRGYLEARRRRAG